MILYYYMCYYLPCGHHRPDNTFDVNPRVGQPAIRNYATCPGQIATPNGRPGAPHSVHTVFSSYGSRKTGGTHEITILAMAIGHWCLMRCSPKRFRWPGGRCLINMVVSAIPAAF